MIDEGRIKVIINLRTGALPSDETVPSDETGECWELGHLSSLDDFCA